MPLPPPRPSLFPYTTLFRSVPAKKMSSPVERSFLIGLAVHSIPDRAVHKPLRASSPILLANERGGVLPVKNDKPMTIHFLPRDRKSTRLNSSHITISYAVFC